MKTLRKNVLRHALLFATGVVTLNSLNACAQATTSAATASTSKSDPAKTSLLQPLQTMVNKLKKLEATGDPDFDYAFQAKIHGQGMQDLLKQEIQGGKDSSMMKIAQALLTSSQTDASTLDATLRQIKPNRPIQAYAQQQSRNVEAMTLKLQQTGASDKLTTNLDKNFAALLLDQRQDVIDMATTYLQFGKNNDLRTYAQQQIDKSKQVMEQVKAAQN